MKALSPTDSLFMWMETRSQPMHIAGLNLYTPPKGAGPGFVGQLMTAWRAHLTAQAPFNQRPVLKMGRWFWEADTEFELDYHLRHLALPQPGRIRELLALVSQLHASLLDRNRPLWEVYVIEGLPGGRFATYSKIHHALVDGVTGARIMADALSATQKTIKSPLWAQQLVKHPRAPLGTASQRLLQSISDAARAGGEILPGLGSGLWELVRRNANDAAAQPFQAPPTPFNVRISGSRRFAAQSFSLARFKSIGKAAGATVNDVTLAVCAGVLRRHLLAQNALPGAPLIAMVPVSLHGQTDAGGNQVALLLANLNTDEPNPALRLQKIVASTTLAKNRLKGMGRLEKLAHAAASLAPAGPSVLSGDARKRPPFNVVISNVPGPAHTLYLNRARLDEVYPVSIPTHYLALNITISGYGDALGFGFVACRRSVPSLQRMLDYTEESLQELEGARARPTAPDAPGGPVSKAKAPTVVPARKSRPTAASGSPKSRSTTALASRSSKPTSTPSSSSTSTSNPATRKPPP